MPGPSPETDREYLIQIYGMLTGIKNDLEICKTQDKEFDDRLKGLESWKLYQAGAIAALGAVVGVLQWFWK
jgi:hypothetical protein